MMIKKISFLLVLVMLLSMNNASAASLFGGDAPIEVNADNMTVDQQQAIAVLSGNVEANQGDMSISSDIMKIFYKKKNNKIDGNSISRIEVEGNVIMKTKYEKAKSQWGLYDVTNGTVTLSNNVTLTKDNNIIKGDKMIHNINTGKSTITNSKIKKSNEEDNKRVRAVFTTN